MRSSTIVLLTSLILIQSANGCNVISKIFGCVESTTSAGPSSTSTAATSSTTTAATSLTTTDTTSSTTTDTTSSTTTAATSLTTTDATFSTSASATFSSYVTSTFSNSVASTSSNAVLSSSTATVVSSPAASSSVTSQVSSTSITTFISSSEAASSTTSQDLSTSITTFISSPTAVSSVTSQTSSTIESTITSSSTTTTSSVFPIKSPVIETTSFALPSATPTQTALAETSSGSKNTGIILGPIVGVFALTTAAFAYVFISRRKRNKAKSLYSENGDLFGPDYYQHDTYNNTNPYSPSVSTNNNLSTNNSTQWGSNYAPQVPMAAAGITNQDHYYTNHAPMGYIDPNINHYNQHTYYDPYQQPQQQYQYMEQQPYSSYNQQMYQGQTTMAQPPQFNNMAVPDVSSQFNETTIPQNPNYTPTTATNTAINTGVTATASDGAITSSTVYSAPNSYPEVRVDKKEN